MSNPGNWGKKMSPKQSGRPEDAEGKISAGLDPRLAALGQAIEQESAEQRAVLPGSRNPSGAAASGYAKGARLMSEFVAGILVGGFLGWAMDQLLGTLPLGLIVFTLLGFAAGILNMARAGRQAQAEDNSDSKGP